MTLVIAMEVSGEMSDDDLGRLIALTLLLHDKRKRLVHNDHIPKPVLVQRTNPRIRDFAGNRAREKNCDFFTLIYPF